LLAELLRGSKLSIVLNEVYEEDGAIVFREACKLGCEGIVSKKLGSIYRRGRSPHWVKVKNPKAPAVKREAEEDWGRESNLSGCRVKVFHHAAQNHLRDADRDSNDRSRFRSDG
jgi:hypothetical protein